jgi:Protein of unknown function (DUF2815)
MSKLVTPEFRGSFVHLLEPHAIKGVENAKARYQITIPIPKKDPFWAKLNGLVEETAKAKWGKIPPKMKSPVKDGDEEERAELAGCYSIQATSNNKPGIVDVSLNPLMDANEIYSGAYYRASIRAFAWDHPTGGKGVSIALDNVMKVKDGEAFSGKVDAAADFADFAKDLGDDPLA